MAIRDLLWTCPLCDGEGTLEPGRGGEVCNHCEATFSRGKKARITARLISGSSITLSPAEWLDRLPEIAIDERIRVAAAGDRVLHEEAALVRTEIGDEPISFRGTFLNYIERFGAPSPGILSLEIDRVVFRPDPGRRVGPDGGRDTRAMPITWDFDSIMAVQPSSRTLQISAARQPLASIQVPGGSIRLWEELLCAALQTYYRNERRSEIVEFQPRITTRPLS